MSEMFNHYRNLGKTKFNKAIKLSDHPSELQKRSVLGPCHWHKRATWWTVYKKKQPPDSSGEGRSAFWLQLCPLTTMQLGVDRIHFTSLNLSLAGSLGR